MTAFTSLTDATVRAPHLQRAIGDSETECRTVQISGFPLEREHDRHFRRRVADLPEPNSEVDRLADGALKSPVGPPFGRQRLVRALLFGNIADRERPWSCVPMEQAGDHAAQFTHIARVVSIQQVLAH